MAIALAPQTRQTSGSLPCRRGDVGAADRGRGEAALRRDQRLNPQPLHHPSVLQVFADDPSTSASFS